MTQVILPNLRQFSFRGASAYLELLVTRISAPVLNELHIILFNQLSFKFPVPRLSQFMHTSENLGSGLLGSISSVMDFF
jgi:hypothetical protein